jgi:hypothetical protein
MLIAEMTTQIISDQIRSDQMMFVKLMYSTAPNQWPLKYSTTGNTPLVVYLEVTLSSAPVHLTG